ncbi:MAG: NADH-quinone oxidoreductase subunit NuoG [Gammaproteobacteria bacterium]|nr:NADH-quinone oxidoreductase subunit NuoG [Gammaproteobacteria bacterium]
MVNIEINGIAIQARDGVMLIEAADEAGIRVPRFCYHKKLSVAANCRMCLVEVEKAPKPMPACATPVTEGMVVFTKSKKALAAQKAVMEFLLINHPLDCPICDQGGECDLQEMALGYGQDISRFSESKRVVSAKNIGPLIATDMTRCIHCTRCVRFGQEVAGIREMGATGRGEHTEIGTYIEKSISSEVSANIIDLCPVGALTSKPFRYSARPWELNDRPAVAPHDCLGSNIFVQTRRSEVMRVLPRENDEINEVWLSDRDRFSYLAVNSQQRLSVPMIKVNGKWEETDWNTALEFTKKRLTEAMSDDGNNLATLISPNATVEEMFLAQKLARSLGSNNIDHRLRQSDFSDQALAPAYPSLGMPIKELESVDAALLIGCNVRKEQPLAAIRLRKAAMHGAKVMAINPVDYGFNFPLSEMELGSTTVMVKQLAGVAKALLKLKGEQGPAELDRLFANIDSNDIQLAMAEHLHSADKAVVLMGNLTQSCAQYADIRALASLLSNLSAASLGQFTDGANAAGGWLSGAIPHRLAAAAQDCSGMNVTESLEQVRKAYLLIGLEPELDINNAARTRAALQASECVISLSSFDSDALREQSDVLLPIAAFTETSGTYVNCEGKWQSFAGAVQPSGEARPAWKILRVLGNFFELSGFDYVSSEEVRDELHSACADIPADKFSQVAYPSGLSDDAPLQRLGEISIYAVDAYTRRSEALQNTIDAMSVVARMNSQLASSHGIQTGDKIIARQGEASAMLIVEIDERVADACVVIPAGVQQTADLGENFASVSLTKNG